MGIYTGSRYFGEAYDYASEIPADESYNAAFGAALALADCQANDMALFESCIYSDVQEISAMYEGYGYVNENAFTDVLKKIKELFMKLLAKIKGIFKAFIAKLTGAFKNGKDLVKKYEKQILTYQNWKKFKIKDIRRPKKGNENIVTAIKDVFPFTLSGNYEVSFSQDKPKMTVGSKKVEPKVINDMEATDLQEEIAKGNYIDGPSLSDGLKDIETDVFDYLYEDEDTIDGDDENISGSFFSVGWIKDILKDSEKTIKDAKKQSETCEKVINKIIDDLNKTEKKLVDIQSKNKEAFVSGNAMSRRDTDMRADGYSKDSEYSDSLTDKTGDTANTAANGLAIEEARKYVQALQKVATNENTVITTTTNQYMSQIKFAVSQARKIWTSAAAYSSSTHKESVEYYQALGESAAEEFYSNMESL